MIQQSPWIHPFGNMIVSNLLLFLLNLETTLKPGLRTSFMRAMEQSEKVRGNLPEANVKQCNSTAFVPFGLLVDAETDDWDSRGL